MIKIPYNCIECDYLIHDSICGIYSDSIFFVNLNREPSEWCPLRCINRFKYLCSTAIKEVSVYTKDTTTFSYKLELPLTVNNSVNSTIDSKF